MDTLRRLICCCRQEEEKPRYEIPDESTRLIPQTIEPAVSYSNVVLFDQQKLQERLGTIVRSKEGKMVNVGSQIPFNLHNRILPREHRTISRSTSGSFDVPQHHNQHPSSSGNYNDGDVPRQRSYYRSQYAHSQISPSRSPSRDGSRSGHRFGSTITDQPRPTPILNVRLVGYMATGSRGRARERSSQPNELPLSSTDTHSGDSANPRPHEVASNSDKPVLDLGDPSSLAFTWGD